MRPLGVSILAGIVFVTGVLLILAALGFSVLLTWLSASSIAYVVSYVSGLGVEIILVILGAVQVALAYGFWNMRKWAFWTQVALTILILTGAVLALVYIDIVAQIVVLFYLWRVRKASWS